MAKQPDHTKGAASSSAGRGQTVFSGPRARWTEMISRHAAPYRLIGNLLLALVLIFAFLTAIKMMGKGIHLTAMNPEYKGTVAQVRDHKDEILGLEPGVLPGVTLHDLTPDELEALRARKYVAAVGDVGLAGGTVAFGKHAVKAVLAEGILREAATARHGAPLLVRGFKDDCVVVEPAREYKDWLFQLFGYARNPFLALLVGILVTAIFQSSSFTTSFTVGLVAAVDFPLAYAIPIVMGANIGTSVTNIAVAMGYIRRRAEFERAFAGATVHDFFNVLTVLVLFTVEVATGILHKLAGALAGLVYSGGATIEGKPTNIISVIVNPVIKAYQRLLAEGLGLGQDATGIIMTITAVVVLFAALLLLVRVLRELVLNRAESFFDRVLFRNAGVAFVVGLVLTASVQSSSVTTSLVVPLIAAGVLTLDQVFPYFLGANIGTTVTALVAAFATSARTEEQARVGLTLACAHLLFNAIGAIMFYPLRWIPIGMARGLARVAGESKRYAILFVLSVFFGIPLIGIAGYWLYNRLLGG